MKRPNIVFLMTDQQRFDQLGLTNPAVKTPNLDALAGDSVFFTRAYTPNPVCVPARAGIATGRYPSQYGLLTNKACLPANEKTFMAILRDAGYYTAVIGKQHFNKSPIDHGYVYEDIVDTHNAPNIIDPEHSARSEGDNSYLRFLYANGFRRGNELSEPIDDVINRWKVDPKFHVDSYIGDRAIDWLSGNRPDDRPWYLCVSFPGPHGPVDGHGLPEEALYDLDAIDMPKTDLDSLYAKPDYYHGDGDGGGNGGRPIEKRFTEEHIRRIRRAWYANITLIDNKIGEIIRVLKETGNYDDTLIIYTTDHGDFTCDYNRVNKGHFLLDILTRIPLMVKPPVKGFSGRNESAPVSSLDLAATCLNAAGLPVPENMQSTDLSNSWKRENGLDDRKYVYLEAFRVRGICSGRWKLICREDNTRELYDLENDPAEQENLYNRPECRKLRDRLAEQLMNQMIKLSPLSMKH